MRTLRCNVCNKEIINNEKEDFHLSITSHPKDSKFSASVTYNYIICYKCNNYLSNLLTVYFNNMGKFRSFSTAFIDIYSWFIIYFISNKHFVNFRFNLRKIKSKFFKNTNKM